nr:hypothetical protein [Actinomadura bangladeshensis]
MVDTIIANHAGKGFTMPAEVERAMRTVAREVFTPGISVEQAYENTAVITARRGDEAISSVAAPYLIAEMLGQAVDALGGLQNRAVADVGSGGYNASLPRELAGPAKSATTVDIDPQVTDRAAACLARAGYNDVTAGCPDAEPSRAGPALRLDHRHRRSPGHPARLARATHRRRCPRRPAAHVRDDPIVGAAASRGPAGRVPATASAGSASAR